MAHPVFIVDASTCLKWVFDDEIYADKAEQLLKDLYDAGIPRTTAYHLLDSLEQKGLVGYVIKGSVKYFQGSESKRLISSLEEKKK